MGQWSFGAIFFYQKQYALDYVLAAYKKPLISLIIDVVMGGGAGLSMHAEFRVITECCVCHARSITFPQTALGHELSIAFLFG